MANGDFGCHVATEASERLRMAGTRQVCEMLLSGVGAFYLANCDAGYPLAGVFDGALFLHAIQIGACDISTLQPRGT